eukprot:1141973-Prymnesium_polylepis.1
MICSPSPGYGLQLVLQGLAPLDLDGLWSVVVDLDDALAQRDDHRRQRDKRQLHAEPVHPRDA